MEKFFTKLASFVTVFALTFVMLPAGIRADDSEIPVEPVAETQTLVLEEFVAVNSTNGANYSGISVGFETSGIKDATAIEVTLTRADKSTVVKRAAQKAIDILNKDDAEKLTAPFFIKEDGSLTEENDSEYWVPAPAIWNEKTLPTRVEVRIETANGDVFTKDSSEFRHDSEGSWPSYWSMVSFSEFWVSADGDDSAIGTQDAPFATIGKAIDVVEGGQSINLASDFTLDSPVVFNKGVALNGNGHTMSVTGSFSGGHVILINASDVTIQNLTVDGGGNPIHGIQAYKVTGVTLNNVTVQNNGKSGLLVNGSEVTASNLTTSGNGWNGVNVDRGSSVETAAVLTIMGTSSHDEEVAIWVDDVTKENVTVNDSSNQYVSSEVEWTHTTSGDEFVGRAYTLAPEPTPTPTRRSGGSRAVADRNTGEVAGAETGPVGEVLGASAYNFTRDLTIGSRGDDVVALQAMLIASGDLAIDAPTGYFGELTKEALAKWQARNGVPATGYFGPLTRAAVAAAGTPAPTMTDAQRTAMIAELLKKVLELQEKINNL